MRNFKIVLSTLFVAALGLAVSSFTAKDYDSGAFTRVCYKLKASVLPNGPSRVISTSQLNTETNNDTEISRFTTASNWETTTGSPIPTDCDNPNYVCAVCFDDTKFTLQQVLDALAAKIESNTINVAHNNSYSITVGTPPNQVTDNVDFYERTVAP